jgi:hypothetical protein
VSLAHDIAEIAEAVDAARRAVAEGATIAIDGLDKAVAKVCALAQAVPAAERGDLARDFTALADALDGLAADIVKQRERAQRQRASAAYGDAG